MRSIDDRALMELLGRLPKTLLDQAVVVIRTGEDAEPRVLPRFLGEFPLVTPADFGVARSAAATAVSPGNLIYLPRGWTIERDAQQWRLARLAERSEEPQAKAEGRAIDSLVPSVRDGSLDGFFKDLARVGGDSAVGLLTAGCASAGQLGLRALAEAGGLTMLETPTSPSGIDEQTSRGFVDCRGYMSGLAADLEAYLEHLQRPRDPAESAELHRQITAAFPEIAERLYEQTSHSFRYYKPHAMARRVRRRMQVLRIDAFPEYLQRLRHEPSEAMALFSELLIGVTQFFRDPAVFGTLESEIIPQLFEEAEVTRAGCTGPDRGLRVWVPGCSTGQEAYTLAMLFAEEAQRRSSTLNVEIIATDIDRQALQEARWGVYPRGIEAEVSTERLKRFFHRRGENYRVAAELREMCRFSAHDLISDPPPTQCDLICCRNLLIYLRSHLQKKLIPLFHHALRTAGVLVLGPSESTRTHVHLFQPVHVKHRISRHRPDLSPRSLEPPIRASKESDARDSAERRGTAGSADERIAILERELQQTREELARKEQQLSSARQELQRSHDDLRGMNEKLHSNEQRQRVILDATERARREAEARVQLAIDAGGLGYWHWEIGSDELVFSRLQRQLVGLPPHGPITVRDFRNRVHPEDLGQLQRKIQAALQNHTRYEDEYRVVHPDGTIRWLAAKGDRTYDKASGRELLIGMNWDITDRKEAEQRLRQATEQQRMALEAGRVGHWCWELSGDRWLWGGGSAALFGLAEEDLVADSAALLARVHAADRQRLEEGFQAAIDGARDLNIEVRVPWNDGTDRWLLVRGVVQRTEDGMPTCVNGISIDVTQRKRAAEGLKRLRETLAMADLSERGGAWTWDRDQDRMTWSTEFRELVGIEASIPPSLPHWFECVHEEDRGLLRSRFDEAIASGTAGWNAEYRVNHPEHGRRWLSVIAAVSHDAEGQVIGMTGVNLDVTRRKAADERLRRVQEQYRVAMRSADLGAWTVALSSGELRWDARCRHLVGDTGGENGSVARLLKRVHPNDRPQIEALIDQAERYETGASYQAEFRVLRPQASGASESSETAPRLSTAAPTAVRWIRAIGQVIRQSDLRASGGRYFTGVMMDVTERVAADRAVRESEQRLRRLVDTAQVGIAFARLDGRIVECNQALLEILGSDRETFEREGLNWRAANLPIGQVLESGEREQSGARAAGQFEVPLVRRDGSRVETLCSVRRLEEAEDEFVTIVVDLTPLRTAEEQLRRSEDKLRSAAEGAGFGAYEIDFALDHISWSPELRKLLGLSGDGGESLRGNTVAEFAHPDDREAAVQAFYASLDPAGDGSLRHEFRIVRSDGSVRWLLVRGSTVFSGGADSRPLRATGIALDVSDRKRVEQSLLHAQAQAEAANQSKSEFLANMSHEIRTPMTAILGYADLVAEQLSNPQALEHIETIRRNGKFLLDIINDILDLSKIDAGKLEIRRQACDIGQLITDVCSLMEVRVREKGLQLIVEFENQIPQIVETDPTRLRQVLVNLIGNAVKFTEQGTIEVVVRHHDARQQLEVDVIDTGIGIAEEVQAGLFAPFTQVDTSINRQFGGTGLGLAISRRLAQMLGGEVTFESVLGEGSCFTVAIATGPLAGVPRISPVLRIAKEERPHGPDTPVDSRILVVDDSRDIRVLASTLLKRSGARVSTADGGQSALEAVVSAAAEGDPFALVFMDVQMPGMDGPTAVGRLRQAGYTLPIVALTANAMQGDRERCLSRGYSDYLSKPLDVRTLNATLQKHLQN